MHNDGYLWRYSIMRIGTRTVTAGIVCLGFILSAGMAVGALTHQYQFEGNAADGNHFAEYP